MARTSTWIGGIIVLLGVLLIIVSALGTFAEWWVALWVGAAAIVLGLVVWSVGRWAARREERAA